MLNYRAGVQGRPLRYVKANAGRRGRNWYPAIDSKEVSWTACLAIEKKIRWRGIPRWLPGRRT